MQIHPHPTRTHMCMHTHSLTLTHTDTHTHTQVDNPSTMSCHVRQHLFEMSQQHMEVMDIRSGPMLGMLEHARYKYLVHVDGQALSSRMEQLMPLGSLIFKVRGS